jgi:hypothetical protein
LVVAELANLGQLKVLPHAGSRGQRHAATAALMFGGSVVLGQKSKFSHNLLQNFMQYVTKYSVTLELTGLGSSQKEANEKTR